MCGEQHLWKGQMERVLIAGVAKATMYCASWAYPPLVTRPPWAQNRRLRLHVVVVDEGVHLVDGGLEILACLLVLGQTAGTWRCASLPFMTLISCAVPREKAVCVPWAAQDVVARVPGAGYLHQAAGGLDGVDQGLARPSTPDLGVVPRRCRGVLDPHHWEASRAQRVTNSFNLITLRYSLPPGP